MIAGVIGIRASVVLVNLAPNTCPIVNASSGNDSKPESTKSSNNPGSSKFSGLITIPSSALQQNTALSFKCSFAVSTVIDITSNLQLIIYYYVILSFYSFCINDGQWHEGRGRYCDKLLLLT